MVKKRHGLRILPIRSCVTECAMQKPRPKTKVVRVDMRTGVEGFQGQRLRQLRAAHNLALVELGEQIGRSPSTLSAWENGSQLPEADSLVACAKCLVFLNNGFSSRYLR